MGEGWARVEHMRHLRLPAKQDGILLGVLRKHKNPSRGLGVDATPLRLWCGD